MSFAASEYHGYYQLSLCSLRVYLRAKGTPATEPDAYHELLVKLGQRHEQRHLSQLGQYFDARGDVEETRRAVARRDSVIYQPEMKASHPEYGDVVGRPDFFIREGDGYVIGDCKLARRFNEDDHPEIFRQLELYGWLYEQTFGIPPIRIEAYMGDGQTQIVPNDPVRALEVMGSIQSITRLAEEPFEAIGWSKCQDCGYNDYCWKRAKETHAVDMLPGVDQALARAFHKQKATSYDELLLKYDVETLAQVQKDVGGKIRKVGNGARKIFNHAKAFQTGEMIRLQAPAVKKAPNVVMFDVEGIPPHLDYSEKTYLWGLKIFGEKLLAYSPAVATATPEGDCDGWQKFLEVCSAIFAEYGSIPFVHWSSYEKTQVNKYIKKCGDGDGIASRVLENLHDLRPVVEKAFVLPTPTYGLKAIERFAGYKRKLIESGGKWSMATYIEAIETEDPAKASELMGEILKYNEEDLDATWFVYQWVLGNGYRPAGE
jgi:predicted RecB family nuclease